MLNRHPNPPPEQRRELRPDEQNLVNLTAAAIQETATWKWIESQKATGEARERYGQRQADEGR